MTRRPHTLVVRLDRMGDVLLTGPAVRAVAAGSRKVTFLAGPHGREAAAMLPGVDEVLDWRCPWIELPAPDVESGDVADLVSLLRSRQIDRALVCTSFHQSALPTALLLRLAGVGWVGAVSEDYPGSLLDLRHADPGDVHEAERALSLAVAGGYSLPEDDDGRLAVSVPTDTGAPRFDVVLHPGTSAPARAWPTEHWSELGRLLVAAGLSVAVSGTSAERELVRSVCGASGAENLSGRTSLVTLAAVLAQADVAVAANTGTAHLAAATHTPVVSLFAPTVPAVRWAPYRTPTVLLGDQQAACRASRATRCSVPGHPCLTSVSPDDAAAAVHRLRAATRDPVQNLPAVTGGAR